MQKELKAAAMVLALTALAALAPHAPAQARQSEITGFFGAAGGLADPTNLNQRFGWGVDLGVLFGNGLIGTAFYRASDNSERSLNVSVEHYGLGADISLAPYVPDPLRGFRGGLRAGVSALDPDFNRADQRRDVEFSWGPALGYDFLQLGHGLSLGAEAALLLTGGGHEINTLYVLGNLRYWF